MTDALAGVNKLERALREALPTMKLTAGAEMARYTTFRLGGPADLLAEPGSADEAAQTLAMARESGVPVTVIGNGSNLLVLDGGIRGLTVRIGRAMSALTFSGTELTAEAGAMMSAAAARAAAQGLAGLVFAGGIPGTVGGGVYMNAGAYGGEMSQVLESARILKASGDVAQVSATELDMRYRHTSLMDQGGVVLSAIFLLKPDEPERIAARMADYSQRRREKQPLQYPSSGSFFKRPEGYFAGKLIQDAGLKGASVGGAQISELHAGFLINRGNATANDVLALMGKVQNEVQARFGVKLEPEVRIIGEDER